MKGVCLLGGPFDGDRAMARELAGEPPARLWVTRCECCRNGTEWDVEPVRGGEVYDRGEQDEKGWLTYVWRDLNLAGGGQLEERELVPAGAGAEAA